MYLLASCEIMAYKFVANKSRKYTFHFWQHQGKIGAKSLMNLWQQERQTDQQMD
jgi:hypothetical protein